jgi:hypothetical protein
MHRCKLGVAPQHEFTRGTTGAVPIDMLNHSTHKPAAKKTKRQPKTVHNENSVELLRGHPLGERILARQAELEGAVGKLDEGTPEYIAIDTALATLEQYLGADMNHLSDGTARDLNNWLERNKYLGLTNGAKVKHAH